MGKYDKKTVRARGAHSAPQERQPESHNFAPSAAPQDNPELTEIAKGLSKVKFRQKTVGGLDPADVWKKIEELNSLYEKALAAERIRYDLLLQQKQHADQIVPSEEFDGDY